MKFNRVMMSDSYKYSHTKQYPKNTVGMFDYAEARNSKVFDTTVFFGLQYILKEYFSTPISQEEVDEAYSYSVYHGIPFNKNGWDYIVNELDGWLPVTIKAIPEGTLVPTSIPLFTIESNDEYVYWIVSWMETTLMKVWYPSNIATRSYYIKQMLMGYAELTQDNPFVDYQLHSFGDRGSSSVESASVGGMSHLTQFLGTDNFHSLLTMKEFYNVDDITTIGHSIPASEHSSTTAWGKDAEFDMILNHIENNKGRPIIAAVMDSYDYFKAVDVVTGEERFRSKIDSEEYPIFVIRPDSGDPLEIIPKTIDIIEENGVPFSINEKGFKVWDKIRIIWGDGINETAMRDMLDIFIERGYSTENIAFGMGGALMQGNESTSNNRDTQGWAIKCSSITLDEGSPIDGEDGEPEWESFYVERDVFKDPITAPNKVSKKGRITTYFNPVTNVYFYDTVDKDFDNGSYEVLVPVYQNGVLVKEYTLDEVRTNSRVQL